MLRSARPKVFIASDTLYVVTEDLWCKNITFSSKQEKEKNVFLKSQMHSVLQSHVVSNRRVFMDEKFNKSKFPKVSNTQNAKRRSKVFSYKLRAHD